MLKLYLLDLLFPKLECSLCGRNINNPKSTKSDNYLVNRLSKLPNICGYCKEQMLVPLMPYCSSCHKPLKNSFNSDKNNICSDCRNLSNRSFIFNRSAILYNDFAKDLIALYKYRGKQSLANEFSYFLMATYEYYYNDLKIDYLTYVPIHNNRLQERGFNQAELLTVRLHELSGIPIVDSLARKRDTSKQSKQRKEERFRQIEGTFSLIQGIDKQIENKNILIIDDIHNRGNNQ